jgi:TRAP-type mannitol/chloroaromatic compound transport system substrate-binding protein
MKTTSILGLAAGATGLMTMSFAATPAAGQTTLDMQSGFPSSVVQIGTNITKMTEIVSTVTDGRLEIRFREPGALVPALESFDAVSTGSVPMAFGTPAWWAGTVPVTRLFGAIPFGPEPPEHLAWLYHGGGIELLQKAYAEHNVHVEVCGMVGPEGAGWFREPMETVEDMRGLIMRHYGMGALVMEELGVSTQLLAAGDIYPALELGSIDAAEFSQPAIDISLGFYEVASHYYLPGWHQPTTINDLMINMDVWNGLSEADRATIQLACRDNTFRMFTEAEAIQADALQQLQDEHGVTLHRWSDEQLDAFEDAWNTVIEREIAERPAVAEAWESLSAFREKHALWREFGYLNP